MLGNADVAVIEEQCREAVGEEPFVFGGGPPSVSREQRVDLWRVECPDGVADVAMQLGWFAAFVASS